MTSPHQPTFTLLAGPSGVGKDAVLDALQKRLPQLHVPLTVTTRPMRPGEKDGREYRFVDDETFLAMEREKRFLETALVHGCFYGTPKDEVVKPLAEGRNVILKVDVQGAEQVKRLMPQALGVFLMPEGEEQLRRRLELRGLEPADLETRLGNARWEMERGKDFEHVLVNREGKLEETVALVERVILGKQV